MHSPTPPHLAIIGGGIGGLALAVACKTLGVPFHLYERAAEFGEVGAGIGLSESTLRILGKLGLLERAKAQGRFVGRAVLADKRLRTIRVIPTQEAGMCIDRPRLIDLLSEPLEETDFSLNRELDDFREDGEGVELHFTSGQTDRAAFLVACDGINSPIRRRVYPELQKRYSGQTIWRGISTVTLPEHFHDTYYELWGDNLRFGVSPMTGDRFYWYAVQTAPAGEREDPGESRDLLQRLFRNYAPSVGEIIHGTPAIIRDDMWDLRPHRRPWHLGRLIFLGDAIHATTPNLAQGGCQAIEDAYALATACKKHGLTTAAAVAYERVRRPKTTYVVDKSWQFGRSAHSRVPGLVGLNALAIKHLLPDSFFCKQYATLTDLGYLDAI